MYFLTKEAALCSLFGLWADMMRKYKMIVYKKHLLLTMKTAVMKLGGLCLIKYTIKGNMTEYRHDQETAGEGSTEEGCRARWDQF